MHEQRVRSLDVLRVVIPHMTEASDNSRSVRALVRLREMLLNGVFEPGEWLSELRLVELLGMSRSPVRYALARLEHEGLLERRKPRGYVARTFTAAELRDAIELRGVLEGSVARLAAERGCDAVELMRMQASVDEMETIVQTGCYELEPLMRYVQLNDEFHTRLIQLSGSTVMERALAHALTLPFAAPSAFVLHDRQHEMFVIAQSHHRDLVQAIRDREGARAESVGREHARLAGRSLQQRLKQLPLREGLVARPRANRASLERSDHRKRGE
jgi:GntR family transcriptional regulator of vanillate catabolism